VYITALNSPAKNCRFYINYPFYLNTISQSNKRVALDASLHNIDPLVYASNGYQK
jgi:hypothetical protein